MWSVIRCGLRVGVAARELDNALHDIGALAQFARAFVEVFAARTGTVEHFRRGDVVGSAAEIPG